MKILIITQQTIPHSGGLSTHIETLVNCLKKEGNEVRLIQGGDAQPTKWHKIRRLVLSFGNKDKFITNNFKHLLANLTKKIQKEIKEFSPDIIHSHDVYASFAALQTSNLNIDQILQTIHGPALYEAQMGGVDKKPNFKNVIIESEKQTFSKLKQFIAVDTGQANILINDYGVDPSLIKVIFNGVDVDEVQKFSSNKISWNIKTPYFLVPRRLVEKTGVRYAIEAIALMENKSCSLYIAGQGPLLEKLKSLTKDLGVENRVFFLGAVERKSLMPLYAKAVGVIVPSIPASGVVEATSLAVTEAMAAGSIPIASNIGGLAELIENGVTGILFPHSNALELAKSMDSLLADKAYGEAIKDRAKVKVNDDYSSDAWLQKIKTIYKSMNS